MATKRWQPLHEWQEQARGQEWFDIEGADHGIRVRAEAPGGGEPPLAEGYLETLRDWVAARELKERAWKGGV